MEETAAATTEAQEETKTAETNGSSEVAANGDHAESNGATEEAAAEESAEAEEKTEVGTCSLLVVMIKKISPSPLRSKT